MFAVAPYVAVVGLLSAATLGVRTNGGGIFVVHQSRLTGAFALQYYAYLWIGVVSVFLATAMLVSAYILLDWRIVLGIHVVFTVLPFAIGTWLWRQWGRLSSRPLIIEVSVFHLISIGFSLWFIWQMWF